MIKESERMSSNTAKKGSKGIYILVTVLIVVLIVAAVPMLMGYMNREEDSSNQATITLGDVKTTYAFSGVVESKNRQEIISAGSMQINEIKVKEGQTVKKDSVLFVTSTGEEIKSTAKGKVVSIYVEKNAAVLGGTRLCSIVDFTDLQVTVKVDEYDLSSLKLDKRVTVEVGAVDKTIKGTVSKLSDEAINQNGVSYFTATIDLDKSTDVKVGMNCEVTVTKSSVKDAIIAPIEAIHFDNDKAAYVLLKNSSGAPTKASVIVGISDGTNVEIKEGLRSGDVVVVETKKSSGSNGFRPPFMRD